MSLKSRKFAFSAVMAVILAAAGTVAVTPLTSSAAYAQGNSGGNGAGNRGNGRAAEQRGRNNAENRSNGRASTAGERSNRGALASELKGLNAAHASAQAFANAAPDSMPGKLAAFKNEYQSVYDATVSLNDATKALEDFPEFSTDFDEGSPEYDAAFAVYEAEREALEIAVSDAEAALIDQSVDYTESYAALTGGVELSPEAQEELMRLLGLR
ncbi:hypothetical protein [Yoonia sp.]|uniref:hypothetical protein n=1 Tax=Yoonia sp. TaxID=2212373 RepID=UPI00391CE556